ncbi:unannotated protein [freshwater metagenome]|uniref:Unannotated protein n=1 Tax=freshwater metagenome TaxID=449393 RepID=A0A6J7ET20_9ZZZZ
MSTIRASPWEMRPRVDSTKASSEPIRIGSGSTIEVRPASQHPRTMVMRLRLVGPRMATWSPGTSPHAWRAAPTARASSCNWRHGTYEGPSGGWTDCPTKRTPVGRSAARSRRVRIGVG